MVRISGAAAFTMVERLLDRSDRPGRPEAALGRRRGVRRVRLDLGTARVPALALVFPAPHSYTGQDVVELQLAGHPALLQRVERRLLDLAEPDGLDVRRAGPGEFTARAFLAGRMSLTQAEGVAATIAARSDAQLRAAGLLRHDALGRLGRELSEELTGALALVEAGIDFTDEEDVVAIDPIDLERRLRDVVDRIDRQLEVAVGAEQLRAIPWVVLRGEPNAGKSTLFNALLGRERAVVSAAAGTTRDVLAEPLAIPTATGEAEILLVDLAGADDDPSALNRAMQAMAAEAIERAELVVRCVPPGRDVSASGPDELVARTKADISAVTFAPLDLAVSAVTGQGLDALRAAIASRLGDRLTSLGEGLLALPPRHEEALRSARSALREALDVLGSSAGQREPAGSELIAAAMRIALDRIGILAGHVTPDEVLDRVFARFCIGK
jgi:tRNA modification GTPase